MLEGIPTVTNPSLGDLFKLTNRKPYDQSQPAGVCADLQRSVNLVVHCALNAVLCACQLVSATQSNDQKLFQYELFSFLSLVIFFLGSTNIG